MLLSPEHPLSREILSDSPEKERRREEMVLAARDARMKRGEQEAEKEGIDTGKKALNPFSGKRSLFGSPTTS